MDEHANRLYLAGEWHSLPAYSHTCCGAPFWRFTVSVQRRSGVPDILPVLAEERLLPPMPAIGDPVALSGQLRAYSQRTEAGNRLHIVAFAREMSGAPAEHDNCVSLTGVLIKPAAYRSTPLGREITDLFLSVPRAFGKSDLLPVIAWGRNARVARLWQSGDAAAVTGRLQSRVYVKRLPDGSEMSRLAYEVSAGTIERLSAAERA